jgi:hypothetical protein
MYARLLLLLLALALGFSPRWIDAGKFLTGFSAVGSIAIPAILAHAQVWVCVVCLSVSGVCNMAAASSQCVLSDSCHCS